ncbi:hypothetical protein TSOC_001400 [Tetrabaena socialis]|uniref:Rhodanese domain-containing protein n=1 Tax=Tetrabaena socialis TaxID=47790 RepID=A0A2J8AGU0_9CHLO|nr:hypothetical protein TSOC_001400 [Tetrabaena socialis]|eukprot:PNH11732.1 hypothetical protein TSOC_001400 [Tetrabaena socialis]
MQPQRECPPHRVEHPVHPSMALATDAPHGPNSPRIIDVRTAAEYAAGHIAGAVHASFLPPWSWPSNVAPLLASAAPEAELYVICLSAHRSIGALKWLRERGHMNVRQLQARTAGRVGGMQAWRAQKMPEVRGGQPGDAGGQQAGAGPEAVEGTQQQQGQAQS